MTEPIRRLALLACAAVIALGSAACTAGTPDASSTSTTGGTPGGSVVNTSGASSSPTASPTQSATTSPAVPTPSVIDVPTPTSAGTSASLDAQAQEAADRAAIEAQWIQFWGVYNSIVRTPEADRASKLDAVSVDPIKSQVLDAARRFKSEGLDYYGSVTTHPYWVTPVDGMKLAVMRDCQDQSSYGSMYVTTQEKRTVGVQNNSLQAGFVLGDDGVWRVQTFNHLENVPC